MNTNLSSISVQGALTIPERGARPSAGENA